MKVLVMLSGGIDSPVAAHMMAEAGAEVIALHMDNTPYGGSVEQVGKIVKRLRTTTGQEIPMYVAPHGEVNLSKIGETRNPHIRCVLCKRFMMRVGEAFAKQNDIAALVMGDSLGQVASQTLQNIKAEQESVNIPIIRPLIGLDKQEIIEIAKLISTYDLSIEAPGECQIVPKKPSTRANLKKIYEAEAEMDVEGMVKASVEGTIES
jgi:thiamine biosynthesis protein ThiI